MPTKQMDFFSSLLKKGDPPHLMAVTRNLTVSGKEASRRLDIFLTGKFPQLSRSAIKNLLDGGNVHVNGKKAKAGQKVKEGDRVEAVLPEAEVETVEPEAIPLEVLYEDPDIIVVNKPAGLTVHPGAGRRGGTLVNALVHHARRTGGTLSSIGAPLRPGIVHRLDKDTSGVLVAAKNDQSHRALAEQFREHTAERKYVALVWGAVKDDTGSIDMPLGRDVAHRKKISTRTRRSRKAVTEYRVLRRYSRFTLLELKLKTGRTHQIRAHLTAIRHPVVGDQLYGKRAAPPALSKPLADGLDRIKRQCLHARTLGFIHPRTGERMGFRSTLPEDMAALVNLLDTEEGPARVSH
ncbi:MAG: RluA family pseudouridine synthase [Deltaproteobacteria bacterium]|nr:RluA family pseudouridine synthase [Deltaproteobacteria bacterium]